MTIVAADPPSYVAKEVGSGFTQDATVQIPPGLAHGSATAQEVTLERCQPPDEYEGEPRCEPVGSVSVDVKWNGSGPTETSRFHQMFADPFAFFNDHFTSVTRTADASGRLDDTVVEDTALFPSSLSRSQFSSINRFGELIDSAPIAAAVATAASVAHTTEASASAAFTNCPPAPATGTTCDGVLVSAYATGGRSATSRTRWRSSPPPGSS